MAGVEKIYNGKQFLGLIIRKDYHDSGIQFLTDDQSPQQLGYMNREKDYVIAPHVHNSVPRTVELTQEVLIIQRGKVRVDYYDDNQIYLESRIAYEGDIVFLGYGGHGFKMLEDSEIVEVKQGPYCGAMDKVRFEPVEDNKVILK